MRIETETAVRSIVGYDSEVTKGMVERARDILRGKTDADSGEITVHNVRFSDAMDILKVKRRTLRHYIYISGNIRRSFKSRHSASYAIIYNPLQFWLDYLPCNFMHRMATESSVQVCAVILWTTAVQSR